MLLFLLALLSPASASDTITLNGVDISSVRDQRFKGVDVWIDADGNLHLTSERYKVEVETQVEASAAPAAPAAPATLSAPPVSPPVAVAPPVPQAAAPPLAGAPSQVGLPPQAVAPPQASTPPMAPAPGPESSERPARITPTSIGGASSEAPEGGGVAVPAGSWWLATEDDGSAGHQVEILLNGTSVRTVRSGQQQLILDISGYLRPGRNQVVVRSHSSQAAGGPLYVYLGRGSNEGGTVTLAQPDIQHGLGADRNGDGVREYSLIVE